MNRPVRSVAVGPRATGLPGALLALMLVAATACAGGDSPPDVRASSAVEPASPSQPVGPSAAVSPELPPDPGPAADQREAGLPEDFPTDLVVNLAPYARSELPSLIDHGERMAIGGSAAYLRKGGWIGERTGSGDESVVTRSWDEEALTLTFEGNGRWMRLTARSLEGAVDRAAVVRMAEDFVRLGWSGWYERYHGVQGLGRPWRFRRSEATDESS